MNLDFTDRVAIVTGAAHGLGRAIAVAFAERGANVWACDVLEDELRETRTLCVAAGGRCEVAVVDVGDKSAVDGFVGKIAAAGRIDILVNNAGGVLGQVGRPLEQISPRDWQSLFDVNVSGAFFMSQAVAPHRQQHRAGFRSLERGDRTTVGVVWRRRPARARRPNRAETTGYAGGYCSRRSLLRLRLRRLDHGPGVIDRRREM